LEALRDDLTPVAPLDLATSESSHRFVPFYLGLSGPLTLESFHAAAYPKSKGTVEERSVAWLEAALAPSSLSEWTRLSTLLTTHVPTLFVWRKNQQGHVDTWVGGPYSHGVLGIMTTTVELD
jgi:hypothetical protein